MTRNKDLKRLVRARMAKTGEAYTAARAQVIRKQPAGDVAPDETPTPAPTIDYAARAGMSDAAIQEKTGCTWEKWVFALDHSGAATMSHREIAELVSKRYKVGSWWAQTVTVGYERIKGLRERGQRRDGSYEASKSRTFNVPVQVLYDAWANARMRKRWLAGATMRVRTATSPKSMRLDWNGEEGGIVAVGFFPKGKGKSYVAVAHTKVKDRPTVARLKQFWTDRLDALAAQLPSS